MIPEEKQPASSQLILKVLHECKTRIPLSAKPNAAGSLSFLSCLANAYPASNTLPNFHFPGKPTFFIFYFLAQNANLFLLHVHMALCIHLCDNTLTVH